MRVVSLLRLQGDLRIEIVLCSTLTFLVCCDCGVCAVPCFLFIRVAETYPAGTRLQEISSSYKAVPWLSDTRSKQLAWLLIALSLVGNVAAIVFSAITGGLAWQS